MLVTSFYNMADTFFVGMLPGTEGTGAVGVVYPMMAVIQAVGFFFGQGSGNYISRELGKKNYEEASNMAATGFFFAFLSGIVICVFGQLFLEPLAYLLGSTEELLHDTTEYLRIILIGAPFMMASLVLNNQLRYQGSAAYAMVGIVVGAVLNIGLDPLFIFTCNMEVAGAGLATIISQFVSFCLLYIGCRRGGNISISLKRVKFKWVYFNNIFQGGLPSLARQSLASLATICLNHSAKPFGDAMIAAMGVVQRISMFGASTMLGFGQGFQPVCGFNYGAKRYDRVRKGFWFSVRISTIVLFGISILGFIFAPQLIGLFRDDPQVIAYGSLALRLQCLSFPTHGWIVMSNMMEQSMGLTTSATFLSVARQGFFFIPLVLILSACLGALGIQMTQACADLLTFAFSIPIHIHVLKKMGK
jgi:putative MATE family efflux protein